MQCDRLTLRTLHSCLALFDESGQVCAPSRSGPAAAEAARQLHLCGSQMELMEEFEMASDLSQLSTASSSNQTRDTEAHSAVLVVLDVGFVQL